MLERLENLFHSLSILQISLIAFFGSGIITLFYLFTSDLVKWIASFI